MASDDTQPADDPGELAALLVDPALWVESPDDLEDRVMEAIATEASLRRPS